MENISDRSFDLDADAERNFVGQLDSLSSLPYTFDKRHYKKDSRFVNDLYTLTYDDHESLDSVRLFSSFANQVSLEAAHVRFRETISVWFALKIDTNRIGWATGEGWRVKAWRWVSF